MSSAAPPQSFFALPAHDAQKFFMQLKPHGVVAVAMNIADPLLAAAFRLVERRLKLVSVTREARQIFRQRLQDWSDALMDADEPVDHFIVVIVVRVRIGAPLAAT